MGTWRCRTLTLAVVACAVAGCSSSGPSPSRPPDALYTRSAPSVVSSGLAGCSAAGQRTAEVYAALLTQYRAEMPRSSVIYIVRAPVAGFGADAQPGPTQLPADVTRCLAKGLAGFSHVVLVRSRSDRLIPTTTSHGPIPAIKNGAIATFGPVPPAAGRTQVSIDAGGGLGFRGGEYCVSDGHGPSLRVTACGSQWIS